MDFTLLVCTYNRASDLGSCLDALSQMTPPPGVEWEVLVVDNRSTDGTGEMVKGRIPVWQGHLRLIREEMQGVGYARKTGLAATSAKWVAFVDDDCLLAPDWLLEAAAFANTHPNAGAFGGKNTLGWESNPTPLLEAYGESLARQDWGEESVKIPNQGKQALCGAGLVLQREAVIAAGFKERGVLRGRNPATIGAGEDTEVQLFVRNAGYELWYNPAMRLCHRVPIHRMQMDHLLPLHRGFGEAEIYLRLLGDQRPLSLRNRLQGLGWAVAEMRSVATRFWLGYVKYENERPTWLIRLWYAWGCLKGALRLLATGRAR
jgi:glycosyltransferase involved in cell wall biosynthesis